MDPAEAQRQAGLAAMLMQWGPFFNGTIGKLKMLVDQPVIRQPYVIPSSAPLTVAASATGAVFPNTDFSNSLEWPFEVHEIKPVQDAAHTRDDWQVQIKDQTFDRLLSKAFVTASGLVDNNTGVYRLLMPWVIRPKGGGFTIQVNNLDTVNPITVQFFLRGYLLIPRA